MALEIDTIVCGDCLDVMAEMPDNGIDTIITDPPYGLEFMGKDWDKGVPGPRYWREALRVAKPGAFLLAFGGTRTWHRLACAIEDAGWELRDAMMWLYAQGFPKSHDISKAIDKTNGARRKVVGIGPYASRRPNADHSKQGLTYADDNYVRPAGHTITAPATEAAQTFDGYGTGLKPAWEPIIVAMKPCDGTFAHNALTWGVAGLNIDGGRIGTGDNLSGGSVTSDRKSPMSGDTRQGASLGMFAPGAKRKEEWSQPPGRFPANLLLTHAPGCRRRGTRRVKSESGGNVGVNHETAIWGNTDETIQAGRSYADPDGLETVDDWECVEGCPVRMLGEQSGETSVTGNYTRSLEKSNTSRSFLGQKLGDRDRRLKGAYAGDRGTASRFFYQAKASRRERNLGCQDVYWRKDKSAPIGFVRISQDEWESLPEKQRARGNIHPTIKPLGIVEYLCRLTRTPTGGVVFDPFCGTGTTALGAIKTGRRWLCCDNQPDYIYLANLRIEALKRELAQMELAL